MLFRVLGPVDVEDDSGAVIRLRPTVRRLLAALLVDAGRVVSVDRAIDALWGESPPSDPERSLQVQVSRLRKSLGPNDVVVSRAPGYLLRVEPDQLDAAVFERLMTEARGAIADGALAAAEERLSSAEGLWRGPAFEDMAFEEFARVEAVRLDQLRVAALTLRFDCWLQMGRHAQAIPELEVLTSKHPLDEHVACQLALALYRAGRQADALRALDRLRVTLRDEVGAELLHEADALYEALLRHDPGLMLLPAESAARLTQTMGLLTAQAAPGPRAAGDANRLLGALLAEHSGLTGGHLFRPIDGVLAAVFDDVPSTVATALAVFESVSARDSPPRLAIGGGEFEMRDGEAQGLALHGTMRLMGAVAPGQVVISESAMRLGIGPLPPGWVLFEAGTIPLPGVTAPERVTVFARADGSTQRLRASGRARLSNLPEQLTSFVGRTAELGELNRLVDRYRLVTVTGPGGVGKTRLCLQMAADRVGTFADGVWLVEVAPLSVAGDLTSAIAEAARIQAPLNTDPIASIEDWIEARHMLLVFDDCERLVESVARLVDRLLRVSPGLRILASSREPLGVPSEVLWTVPLLVPPEEYTGDLAPIGRNEAVRLFVERAASADPTFGLDATTAPLVVRICRAVEGIPLAVELAAGQLRKRTLAKVSNLVEQNLHRLASPYRTVADRQRTMAATVDWSYGLLGADEQIAFRRLSVFAGTFDAESAAVICGFPPDATEVLLDHLADQSLLAEAVGGLRMLQPIRSRASDLLESSGEAVDTLERHAIHFLSQAAEARMGLRSPQQAAWIDRLGRHRLDNQGAIQWGLDRDPALTARAVVGIAEFLYRTRSMSEALGLLEAVRRDEGIDDHTRNRVDLEVARIMALEEPAGALPILEDLQTRPLDRTDRLHARLILTGVHAELGNLAAARAVQVDPEDADETGDPVLRILSRIQVSYLTTGTEDAALGDRNAQEAYDLARELQMPYQLSTAANYLAWRTGVIEGRIDQALQVIEEGLAAAEAANSPNMRAWCLGTKAEILVAAGQHDRALPVVVEAAHVAIGSESLGTTLLVVLETLALVLTECDALEEAGRVHGASHPTDDQAPFAMDHVHSHVVDSLHTSLGAKTLAILEEEGRRMPIADLLDRAGAVVAGV